MKKEANFQTNSKKADEMNVAGTFSVNVVKIQYSFSVKNC